MFIVYKHVKGNLLCGEWAVHQTVEYYIDKNPLRRFFYNN